LAPLFISLTVVYPEMHIASVLVDTEELGEKLNEKLDRNTDVESSHHSTEIPLATPEEEKLLVRKLDRRILPITCVLYLFSCMLPFLSQLDGLLSILTALNRTNIGNARLQGLPGDVLGGDKTGVLFDWLTSGFYFSYVNPSDVSRHETLHTWDYSHAV